MNSRTTSVLRILTRAKWLLLPLTLFYAFELFNYFKGLQGFLLSADNRILGRDFSNWWTAACLTLDSNIMTLFDFDLYHEMQEKLFGVTLEYKNWSYPPHIIFWVLGLGLLPYTVALVLWTVAGLAVFLFAVSYKRPQPRMLALIAALAPSSAINIVEGQTGFFTAACLVGGLRMLDEAPVFAGVLFGILSFKPHFGFFVPLALLIGRYWRVFFAATATVVGMVAVSIYFFGIEPWDGYINLTMHYQQLILEADMDGQIYQAMMISPFMAVRLLGGSLAAAYSLTAVAVCVAVTAVIYAFWRCPSRDLRAAILITATFLASPYMFTYDTSALSAAIMLTIAAALQTKTELHLKFWHLALFAIAWVLPLATIELNNRGFPLYPLVVAALLAMQIWWVQFTSALRLNPRGIENF